MKFINKLNNRGDTIIEVLIVLAVLSLAFSLSAATANKALQHSRLAEEHAQAMGVLNEQVELLRKALENETQLTSTEFEKFCLDDEGVPALSTSADCNNTVRETSNSSIQLSPDRSHYVLDVSWDGPGNSGRQHEIYKYRVYPKAGSTTATGDSVVVPPGGTGGVIAGGGYTTTSPTQASITVIVKKIPPRAGNNRPACSDPATQDRANTTVRLRNINNGSYLTRSTSSTSVAAFTIPEQYFNNSYTAEVVTPSGFGVCPPNPTSSTYAANEPAKTVNMTIYPLCSPQYSHTNPGYYSVGRHRPDLSRAYLGFGGGYPYLDPNTPYGSSYAPGVFFYSLWWDQAPTYYLYGYNRITSFNNWLYNGPSWGHYYQVYEAVWNPAVPVYNNVCMP